MVLVNTGGVGICKFRRIWYKSNANEDFKKETLSHSMYACVPMPLPLTQILALFGLQQMSHSGSSFFTWWLQFETAAWRHSTRDGGRHRFRAERIDVMPASIMSNQANRIWSISVKPCLGRIWFPLFDSLTPDTRDIIFPNSKYVSRIVINPFKQTTTVQDSWIQILPDKWENNWISALWLLEQMRFQTYLIYL